MLYRILFVFLLTTETLLASGMPAYQDSLERVQLFLSEEVLAAGKTLWFQAILLGDTPRSRVLCVEVMGRRGAVVQGIYPAHEGIAQGQLTLPDTLSNGWYQVRAYTQWMRNQGASTFETQPLLVLNPNKRIPRSSEPVDKKVSAPSAESTTSGSTPLEVFIVLSKTRYRPREPVSAAIQLPEGADTARVAVAIRKVSPIARGAMLSGPLYNGDRLVQDDQYRENTEEGYRYPREDEGLLLSGTARGMSEKTTDRTVVLSVPGKNPYFEYDVLGQDDRFQMPVRETLFGIQNVVLQAIDTSAHLQWQLDEKFAPENTFSTDDMPGLPPSVIENIHRTMVQRAQINAQYDLYLPQDSTKRPDQVDFRFYGAPNFTVRPDEYIALPTFTEMVRELMTGVRLKKSKGKYDLDVFDVATRNFLEGEPSVFVDGVLIHDLNYLVGLSPDEVDLIEIVNRRTYYGEYRMAGTVAIYTKAEDAYLPALPTYAWHQPSSFYTLPIPFSPADSLPVYQPDLRTLLLWKPSIRLTRNSHSVEAQNADELGEFEIVVAGTAPDGRPVYGRTTYEVMWDNLSPE